MDIIQEVNKYCTRLLPVLRSETQAAILTAVLGHPDREYSVSKLVELSGASQPTVSREVRRAEDAGLVDTRKVGKALLVKAETGSPFYRPLRQLLETAFGPPGVVGDEFAHVEGIDRLILFGSWVARSQGESGSPPNDIDVLVIGRPNRRDLYAAADRAERRLGLPVQVTVRTGQEWELADDSFLSEVRSRPFLELTSTKDASSS